MTWLSVAIGKPIAASELEMGPRLEAYLELLGDLPFDVFRIATRRVAVAHPWATFPSIAELRQAAADTLQGNVKAMSGGEAWQLAWRAAAKIDPEVEGSTTRACKDLPSLVVEAMKSFGIVALCNADPNFARPQFIKIFESVAERDNRHALLPRSVKKAIDHQAKVLPARMMAIAGRIGVES
jgi:hypothetical protein